MSGIFVIVVGVENGLNMMQIVQVELTRAGLRQCTVAMFPKSAPETPKGPIVYAIKLLLKEIPCNKQDIPGSCLKSRRIDLTQLIHY
jgi:hypothetical protein